MENSNRKKVLDKFFNENYFKLINYTNKFLKQYKKEHLYTAEEVLSEIYIILESFKKWDEIISLEAITKQIIKNTIIFYNSALNRKSIMLSDKMENDLLTVEKTTNDNSLIDLEFIEDLILQYYLTLNSEQKSIWNICYVQKLDKIDLIANHLNISKYFAKDVKKEYVNIYANFRTYIENFIKINIKNETNEKV